MEMDYPKTRMDNFFAKAAGSELADDSMEPITDREYWVNQMARTINGYQLEEDNMEPKTRMDNFFAKAAGSEYADNDMVPITDREYWINEMAAKIAQGGGGGSSLAVEAKVTYGMEGVGFFNGVDSSSVVGALIYDDANEYWTHELNISEPSAPLSLLIINEVGGTIYVYSEPTVTGSATVEQWNDEWWIHVTGDCTISDANE